MSRGVQQKNRQTLLHGQKPDRVDLKEAQISKEGNMLAFESVAHHRCHDREIDLPYFRREHLPEIVRPRRLSARDSVLTARLRPCTGSRGNEEINGHVRLEGVREHDKSGERGLVKLVVQPYAC